MGVNREKLAEMYSNMMVALRSTYDPAVFRTVLFVREIGAALQRDPGIMEVTKVHVVGGYHERAYWVVARFDTAAQDSRALLEDSLERAKEALRQNDHPMMAHLNDRLAERRLPLPR